MTRVRVHGFQIFVDRHGKMRCYHRSTRTVVDLDAAPLGSAQFFAECARIAEVIKVVGPPNQGPSVSLFRRIGPAGNFWISSSHPCGLPAVPRLPKTYPGHTISTARPRPRRSYSRQGSGRAPTALRKLCEDCFVDPIRVGGGTRVHGQKSRREITEHPKTKGRARSQSALVRRGTPRCPRCRSRPYTVRYRADDVHGTSAEGRASTTPALLQGRGNCHPALEDWRTRLLARPGGTS